MKNKKTLAGCPVTQESGMGGRGTESLLPLGTEDGGYCWLWGPLNEVGGREEADRSG